MNLTYAISQYNKAVTEYESQDHVFGLEYHYRQVAIQAAIAQVEALERIADSLETMAEAKAAQEEANV